MLMDAKDNVVTCVVAVHAGQEVRYQNDNEMCSVVAQEDIPYCHKIAIKDIPEGSEVFKYGELIGRATQNIGLGCWVSHLNIASVPRDYDSEMI